MANHNVTILGCNCKCQKYIPPKHKLNVSPTKLPMEDSQTTCKYAIMREGQCYGIRVKRNTGLNQLLLIQLIYISFAKATYSPKALGAINANEQLRNVNLPLSQCSEPCWTHGRSPISIYEIKCSSHGFCHIGMVSR